MLNGKMRVSGSRLQGIWTVSDFFSVLVIQLVLPKRINYETNKQGKNQHETTKISAIKSWNSCYRN